MPALRSLFAILLLLGLSGPAVAAPVNVTIEVLEGSRKKPGFSGAATRYAKQLQRLGYVGARAVDTVTAPRRDPGTTVQLNFQDGANNERIIKVTVVESDAKKTTLKIAIPAYRFDTTTTHTGQGALLVALPKDDLLLAVHPSR